MTTETSSPVVGFFDGWTAALDHVETALTHGDRCTNCILTDARFTGLALAADLVDDTEGQTADQILNQIIRTAMAHKIEDRVTLMSVATQLVELKPTAARDALVTLALIAAKRFHRKPLPIDDTEPEDVNAQVVSEPI